MGVTTDMGFSHFLAQSDVVGKLLLAVLVLMSLISWTLIIYKGIKLGVLRHHSRQFMRFFWNAASLEVVADKIKSQGVRCPFSHLFIHAVKAHEHYARYGASRLKETGTPEAFLTRTIKKALDEECAQFENGLTALATIGATAPFVGLFGTVWGVYHALIQIGMTGAGTLDKVAGPVGEALIMTGVGLAVAIPAVIGYNWLSRTNRVWMARLDSFAYEVFTFFSLGQPLGQLTETKSVIKTFIPRQGIA